MSVPAKAGTDGWVFTDENQKIEGIQQLPILLSRACTSNDNVNSGCSRFFILLTFRLSSITKIIALRQVTNYNQSNKA